MGRITTSLLPATERLAAEMGERLRLARKRRKLTALQMCERAGIAPMTLRAVERGSTGATFGAYLAVMQVLGVQADLNKLAKDDPVGHSIQDADLRRKTSRPTPARQKTLHDTTPQNRDTPTLPVPSQGNHHDDGNGQRPKRADELLALLNRPHTKRK
jgi:transcriptional regulator with XRE-family HTH domain